MTKSLEQLRNGLEFVKYAENHGAETRNGKGSHCIVRTERGSAVVPCHNKELGKGLRAKLVKTYLAMGLAIFVLACGLSSLIH